MNEVVIEACTEALRRQVYCHVHPVEVKASGSYAEALFATALSHGREGSADIKVEFSRALGEWKPISAHAKICARQFAELKNARQVVIKMGLTGKAYDIVANMLDSIAAKTINDKED